MIKNVLEWEYATAFICFLHDFSTFNALVCLCQYWYNLNRLLFGISTLVRGTYIMFEWSKRSIMQFHNVIWKTMHFSYPAYEIDLVIYSYVILSCYTETLKIIFFHWHKIISLEQNFISAWFEETLWRTVSGKMLEGKANCKTSMFKLDGQVIADYLWHNPMSMSHDTNIVEWHSSSNTVYKFILTFCLLVDITFVVRTSQMLK